VYRKEYKINKEMIELIKQLKKRYKLCLLSNTPKFHKKLKASFRKLVEKLFDVIIYSCDVGSRKPEKRIYLFLLKKLRIKPQECAIIDDNIKNLGYPKKIGMKTIHFKSTKQLKRRLRILNIKL
jgi:putative hydrolase of the HAD superfamily